LKLGTVYENEEDSRRGSMILEIGEQKERIKELNDPQNRDRTKMNEEDLLKENEKVMMQEEFIDYKEVMLEEEVHQIQKPKDARRRNCDSFTDQASTCLGGRRNKF
jgi:hypothetical protein